MVWIFDGFRFVYDLVVSSCRFGFCVGYLFGLDGFLMGVGIVVIVGNYLGLGVCGFA